MASGSDRNTPASDILVGLPEPETPEGRLVLAVLLDAVALLREDAFCRARHPRAAVRATVDWVMAEDAAWPLSFVNVCAGLGLDPGHMRGALFEELGAAPGWLERLRGARVTALPGRAQPTGATEDGVGSSRWSTSGPAASHFEAAPRPDTYIASRTSRSK